MIETWARELTTGDPIWAILAIKLTIIAAVILPAFGLIALACIWAERKVSAHMQSRRGPLHVGGFHGWAQGFADGIKLLGKEDLIPAKADAFLFRLAPYIAVAPILAAFAIIPFGPQFVFENGLYIGVLYLLAIMALEIMSTILAGWASNSKWAIYGAMREACQMVSYEVPLGLSIICAVLVAGTLNMEALSYMQGGSLANWLIFHNIGLFVICGVYFVASLAENKRAPFDLPESESELVAGFLTEYSGLRWSIFFMGEYNAMFIVGCIQAILFLGGWNSVLGSFDPVYAAIGYDAVFAAQQYAGGAIAAADTWAGKAESMGLSPIGLLVLNLYGASWVVLKALSIVFIQMWVRWTLPRIRIDQVLYACVKVLLPLSLVCLTICAVWVALVDRAPREMLGVHGALLWHLSPDKSLLQKLNQYALMFLALGIAGYFFTVVLQAWTQRDRQPRQTFFPDIMPVGRDIHFHVGDPAMAQPADLRAEKD